MAERKRKVQKFFRVFLLVLSLCLLAYFCISGNNLVTLLHSLPSLHFFWLLCACVCIVLNWLMDGAVIFRLISAAQHGGYGYGSAFRVTMVGQYFNSVTPYAVGGQPMQLFALIRQGVAAGTAASALVRKFFVYQTGLTLYSLLVILIKYSFFQSRIQGFMALAVIGFVCQAAGLAVLLLLIHCPAFTARVIRGIIRILTRIRLVKNPQQANAKAKDQLNFYLESNRAMAGDRRTKCSVYGYTLLQLTALFVIPFFIYKAFHNPGAPVFDMIAAQSFVTMISSYTPLPGAAGAAEGSFLVIFQIFFPPAVLRQAMLLWRLITYYSCIVAGAFFAGLGKPERGPKWFGRMRRGNKRGENCDNKTERIKDGGVRNE